jgi:hypothetical protein
MSSDESLSGNPERQAAKSITSVFSPQSLVSLLLRPRAFFADGGVLRDRKGILIAAAMIGVTNTMDRIDQNLVKADLRHQDAANVDAFTSWVISSWLNYWGMALLLGMISAVITWYLRGWWYRKRLEWAGATDVVPEDARCISTLQDMVYVLPILAWTVAQTLIYSNYQQAWASTDAAGMLILVFLFWSCWTSYCAATTVYTLNKNKARFWFLILPGVFYFLIMGVYTTLYAMLT